MQTPVARQKRVKWVAFLASSQVKKMQPLNADSLCTQSYAPDFNTWAIIQTVIRDPSSEDLISKGESRFQVRYSQLAV